MAVRAPNVAATRPSQRATRSAHRAAHHTPSGAPHHTHTTTHASCTHARARHEQKQVSTFSPGEQVVDSLKVMRKTFSTATDRSRRAGLEGGKPMPQLTLRATDRRSRKWRPLSSPNPPSPRLQGVEGQQTLKKISGRQSIGLSTLIMAMLLSPSPSLPLLQSNARARTPHMHSHRPCNQHHATPTHMRPPHARQILWRQSTGYKVKRYVGDHWLNG